MYSQCADYEGKMYMRLNLGYTFIIHFNTETEKRTQTTKMQSAEDAKSGSTLDTLSGHTDTGTVCLTACNVSQHEVSGGRGFESHLRASNKFLSLGLGKTLSVPSLQIYVRKDKKSLI